MLNMDDLDSPNFLPLRRRMSEFTRDIKLGKFERSYDVAKRTVVILNQMIKENTWPQARDLIQTLKSICAYIDSLGLVETAASNMVRRVMRIVRDECHNYNSHLRAQQDAETTATSATISSSSQSHSQSLSLSQSQSHQQQFEQSTNTSSGRIDETDTNLDSSNLNLDIHKTGLHENIIEGIEQELMNELDLSSKSIARQAIDYVQTDEIILTLGKSKVIETFLKHAAIGNKTGRRKFTVIVVELAPFYSGREMAKSLNKIGISTLIIPDSAVFAIMSRVNKVLLSTNSMMANGGIKAPAGSHSIALAAKHYAVPVIVCCPMYKLTPSYLVSHDSVAFEQFSHLHSAFPEPYTSPTTRIASTLAIASHQGQTGSGDQENVRQQQEQPSPSPSQARCIVANCGTVESIHSTFDYVQPELITLFVSNIGGNSPSYVYQLLNELYCKSDYLT